MIRSPGYVLGQWLADPESGARPPPLVDAAWAQVERYDRAAEWRPDADMVSRAWAASRELGDRAQGYARRRAAESAIADYLEQVVMPHPSAQLLRFGALTDKLRACRRCGCWGIKPDGGLLVAWDHHCRCSRLCPDEAREEGQRLQSRYIDAILTQVAARPGRRVYYAVLTQPNTKPGRLAQAKRRLFGRFRALLRKQTGKRRRFREIVGALVTQEDPLSVNDAWHVHLNALLICDGWLGFKDLRRAWHWNVGLRALPCEREKLRAALRELVKYPVRTVAEKARPNGGGVIGQGEKTPENAIHAVNFSQSAPPLTEWPAERFIEWWTAGLEFRRTRSYGSLFRLPPPAPERVDYEAVDWIGALRYEVGKGYEISLPSLDLIQADKSPIGEAGTRRNSVGLGAQGPPPY